MPDSPRAVPGARGSLLTWAVIAVLVALPFLFAQLGARPAPDGPAGRAALVTTAELQALGPRVVGDAALDQGLDLVQRKLTGIPGLQVERQRDVSGVQRFAGRDIAYTVDNVIARQQGADDDALLVNVHVDSAMEGPGAADDGVAAGALIEAARRLVGPQRQRTIIYLFNGGEEVGLAGSDAFLSHPWADDVRWFVNLEAVGSAGLPVMFHAGAGSGRMVDLVGDTPRPFGTVVGQQLFDAGLINSDTDSRVWRAQGWTGLDYAIIGDGYAYHTPADRVERIGPGVAQSFVDVVVTIAGRVADGAPVGRAEPNPAFVDVQSRWWLTFDSTTTKVWTSALLLVLLGLLRWARRSWSVPVRAVIGSAGAAGAGTVLALLGGALAGGALWLVGGSQSWFAHPWLVWLLLLPPALGGALLPQALLRRRALRRAPDRGAAHVDAARKALLANTTAVTVVSVATAWLGFGPGYLFWIGSLLSVSALAAALALPGRWWAVPLAVATVAQCLLVAEFARGLITLAVPMFGRLPTAFPLDPVLGAVVAVVAVLLALTLAPLVFRAGRVRAFAATLAVVTASGLVVGAFLSPYDAQRPKYVGLFHTRSDDGPTRIDVEGRDFQTPQRLGLVHDLAAATRLPEDDGALLAGPVDARPGSVDFTGGPAEPLVVRVEPNRAALVRITVTGAVRSIDGRSFDGDEAVLDLVGRPGGHTAVIDRTGPVKVVVDQVFPGGTADLDAALAALPDWVVGYGRTLVQRVHAEPGAAADG